MHCNILSERGGDACGLYSSARKLFPMWLVYPAFLGLSSEQCLYLWSRHLDFCGLHALQ